VHEACANRTWTETATVHVPQGAIEVRLANGRTDLLIREEPLLIEIAGSSVLTMRTPDGNDGDLALGFLLSEGVVRDPAQIAAEHTFHPAHGDEPDRIVLRLEGTGSLAGEIRGRLTRTHEIRSSCGVCGLANPEQLADELPAVLPGVPRLAARDLRELVERASDHQPLFAATGACHGAVVFAADGRVLGAGEDVGRHNALDKAIGAAARAGHRDALTRAVAVLTGRAGYDLVVKCLRLGIPVIASVSAASGQGVELCSATGATLVGFVRGDRLVVYTDGARLES